MVITQGPCPKEAPSYLCFQTRLSGQRELPRDSHKQSNAPAQKGHPSQLTGLNWSHDHIHQGVQCPVAHQPQQVHTCHSQESYLQTVSRGETSLRRK